MPLFRPAVLVEELNGDLWRNFLQRTLNFLRGIRQSVRVDVYTYTAFGAAHGFAQPQVLYRLFEFIAASRALKSDRTRVALSHRSRPFHCGHVREARGGGSSLVGSQSRSHRSAPVIGWEMKRSKIGPRNLGVDQGKPQKSAGTPALRGDRDPQGNLNAGRAIDPRVGKSRARPRNGAHPSRTG